MPPWHELIPPACWDDFAAATDVLPAAGPAHLCWRLIVFALSRLLGVAGAERVLAWLGPVCWAGTAFIVFLFLRGILPQWSRRQDDHVRDGVLRAVRFATVLVPTVLFAASDSVRRMFFFFTPSALEIFLSMASVALFLCDVRRAASGRPIAFPLSAVAAGLLAVDSPLGIALALAASVLLAYAVKD